MYMSELEIIFYPRIVLDSLVRKFLYSFFYK
jgi:hypothetical protein